MKLRLYKLTDKYMEKPGFNSEPPIERPDQGDSSVVEYDGELLDPLEAGHREADKLAKKKKTVAPPIPANLELLDLVDDSMFEGDDSIVEYNGELLDPLEAGHREADEIEALRAKMQAARNSKQARGRKR